MLIQKDLQTLFEFIEPSDTNLTAYSYRTHELLIRTCIEIEANFKAILNENTFNPIDKNGHPRRENRWNIHDYKKVNKTHHLASYRVHIPIWKARGVSSNPFEPGQVRSNYPGTKPITRANTIGVRNLSKPTLRTCLSPSQDFWLCFLPSLAHKTFHHKMKRSLVAMGIIRQLQLWEVFFISSSLMTGAMMKYTILTGTN